MTRILRAVCSGFCKAWNVVRTGPYYYHDIARVCSAELLHAMLLHAEMSVGMVSEVEAYQSPERRYMSPKEFHEFGKDAVVWPWSNHNAPPRRRHHLRRSR